MNILITDDYQNAVSKLPCCALLDGHSLSFLGDLRKAKDVDSLLKKTECLVPIRERTRIDVALLKKMPRLRLVSQTGPAGRHIDMEACTAAGVAVMQGTGSLHAPAELAFLLMMNACRRLPEAVSAFRQGHWQVNIGTELHSKTLGILGFGKLGQQVAGYARAFGMQVVVWGSERSRQQAVKAGYQASSRREDFFARCDVISIHLRLCAETQGSISLADLLRMQPSAVLVNTSRAELLAEGALEAALRQGRPGYAAVDVYEAEPIYGATHPLLALPNVLATPHLGYVAEQSYEAYFRSAFDNVLRFADGDYSAVLNPAALKTVQAR